MSQESSRVKSHHLHLQGGNSQQWFVFMWNQWFAVCSLQFAVCRTKRLIAFKVTFLIAFLRKQGSAVWLTDSWVMIWSFKLQLRNSNASSWLATRWLSFHWCYCNSSLFLQFGWTPDSCRRKKLNKIQENLIEEMELTMSQNLRQDGVGAGAYFLGHI